MAWGVVAIVWAAVLMLWRGGVDVLSAEAVCGGVGGWWLLAVILGLRTTLLMDVAEKVGADMSSLRWSGSLIGWEKRAKTFLADHHRSLSLSILQRLNLLLVSTRASS